MEAIQTVETIEQSEFTTDDAIRALNLLTGESSVSLEGAVFAIVSHVEAVSREAMALQDEALRVNNERAALARKVEALSGEHYARILDVVRAARRCVEASLGEDCDLALALDALDAVPR